MRRAVFLDRVGTLNEMVYNLDHGTVDSPLNPEDFNLLLVAAEAVRRINDMGFLAVVVSNQPGIAKGKFTWVILNAVTEKM
ncbi:HAD family hydrolase, partial [Desulfobacteraceae bacterium SEEP-SAG9]